MNLQTVLSDVFNRGVTVDPLPLEEEIEQIAAARAGDSDAVVALIRAYAPVLRSHVSRHRDTLGADEAQAVALASFVEAIHEAEPGERLASVVGLRLPRDLADAAATSSAAFVVPPRTVRRFFSILRKAEGDVTKAASLAPSYEMTTDTFFAVLDAVRNVGSLDAEVDATARSRTVADLAATPLYAEHAISDAEDAELVALAFEAVTPLEEEVCRLAYGFAEYDPVPDAEIGHRLGFSRAKAQRLRVGALDKMRSALGA